MLKANELKYATRAAQIAARSLRAIDTSACMPLSERFKYCDHLCNQVLCNDLESIVPFHLNHRAHTLTTNHRAHTLTTLLFLQIKSKMIISKKMFKFTAR